MIAFIATVVLAGVFLVAMAVWLGGVVSPMLGSLDQTRRDRIWRTACLLHPILPCLDGGWYATMTWAPPATPAGEAVVAATSILAAAWLIVWLLFSSLDNDLWKGW